MNKELPTREILFTKKITFKNTFEKHFNSEEYWHKKYLIREDIYKVQLESENFFTKNVKGIFRLEG